MPKKRVRRRKKTPAGVPLMGGGSPLFLRDVLRGGAGAGKHHDRRTNRLRTRSAQNRAAIADQ